MANNLKIEQQLNAVMLERERIIQRQSAEIQNQIALAAGLQKALGQTAADNDVLSSIEKMRDALKGAETESQTWADAFSEANKRAGDSMGSVGLVGDAIGIKLTSAHKKAAEQISKSQPWYKRFGDWVKESLIKIPFLGKAILVAGVALDKLGAIGKFIWSTLGAVGKVIISLTGSLWNLGKSILSMPIKMFDSLIEMAQQGGGDTSLIKAFEAIREQFGSFKQAAARDVIGSAKALHGALAETGLSVWRIFGGPVERLEYFTKLAGAMGALWITMGRQIAMNAEAIGAYQKGLGLAEEEMKAFMAEATASGKPITKILQGVASMSIQLGERFGMSSKLISREMGIMKKDMQHFGNLSTGVMGKVVVYFQSLGIEVSNVAGLMDKFDTFESAADTTARLAQQFGVATDAMQLFQTDDPAQRADMLRKAFQEAGHAAITDRRQLSYLSEVLGITDVNTTKLLFSQANLGRSYEEVTAEATKAGKAEMTQTQVMKKLADSIERLAQAGNTMGGGFFEHFFKGFVQGIKGIYTLNNGLSAFQTIMMNIRTSLRIVYFAGIQVGQAFVNAFPGVKALFTALAKYFSPKMFGELMNGPGGIVKSFGLLFDMLKGGVEAKTAVNTFLLLVESSFKDFFVSRLGPGGDIWKSFATIGTTLVKIIGGLVPYVMRGLADMIKKATLMMRDPKKLKDMIFGAAGGAAGPAKAFLDAFKEAFENIKEAWPELKAAIGKLFETLKTELPGWLDSTWAFLKETLGPGMSAVWDEIKVQAILAWSNVIWPFLSETIPTWMSQIWGKIKEELDKSDWGKGMLKLLDGLSAGFMVTSVPALMLGGIFESMFGKMSQKDIDNWLSTLKVVGVVLGVLVGLVALPFVIFAAQVASAIIAVKKFLDACDWIKLQLATLVVKVEKIWNNIKAKTTKFTDDVFNYFASLWDRVSTSCQTMWDTLVGKFDNGIVKVGAVFKKIADIMIAPIFWAFKEMANLIPGAAGEAIGKAADKMQKTWNDKMGIASPAKFFIDSGKDMVDGFKIGIMPMDAVMAKRVDSIKAQTGDIAIESDNLRRQLQENERQVVRIKPQLAALVSGGLLGADGTVKVKRPDSTLNAHFTIVIDAGDMEKVLLDRPGSSIATFRST